MKKVRAVGLAGLAPMVVGFAFPPTANAMATAMHSPGNGAKTVSLRQGERAQASLADCQYGRVQYATSTHAHLTAHISYSHRCIAMQRAILDRDQTGLTERTRYYSYNGTRELQTYTGGNLLNGSTSWTTFPEIYAYEVCQALVANSNHNDVKYGPVCEKATS
jgi:hypothetical protein